MVFETELDIMGREFNTLRINHSPDLSPKTAARIGFFEQCLKSQLVSFLLPRDQANRSIYDSRILKGKQSSVTVPLAYKPSLSLVRVQNVFTSFAIQHERQFPSEVEGVFYGSVQSKSCCWGASMCCVTGNEYSAFSILWLTRAQLSSD